MPQDKLEKTLATVLRRITPKAEERSRMNSLVKELEKRVTAVAKTFGLEVQVRVEGSVAKDTWLSKEPDIDVFMRIPKTVPRSSLGKACLEIARKATEGSVQVERFAEHPYLEAFVDGTRVNIVPCYSTNHGEWLSATDRTPFHTDFVLEHLSNEMRSDVRLLKRFMKGVGVYGAEIKVGGFSGYLCELLALHYGSFVAVLKAFAGYRHRIEVDIEGSYNGREDELRLLFEEPLVVVDPVDKGRNVASAVNMKKLCYFVAAARAFLKKPRLAFFYPPKTTALVTKELGRMLKNRGSAVVFVVFTGIKTVPDVLWGQLYKSQHSLCKLLQLNDFKILRETAWSDEKELNMFVFELDSSCITPIKKHLGPPLDKEKECEKFIAKYVNNQNTVCGPYVEDGRWTALIKRKSSDARELLREKLKDGGRNAGMAEGISQLLLKGFKILVNEEIVCVYERNEEFAVFLTEFLRDRSKWLEDPA